MGSITSASQILGQQNQQRQGLIPAQIQMPKQITKQNVIFPINIIGSFGNVNVPFTPGLVLPPVNLPQGLSFNSIIGKGYKGKLRREYTPSIGAILKGTKTPTISSSVKFAELSGFAARPIISGSKKASSKKSKR